MTYLLPKKTYELDKLMHMFMPVFEEHTYDQLMKSIDPKLDLAIEASLKLKANPQDYDMEKLRVDPWLKRLNIMSKNINTSYSKTLDNALNTLSLNQKLTDGQRLVFEQILTEHAAISTIKGQAGSGKSFATAELIKELVNSNAETLVLAPTHVAVTNINQLIDEVRQQRFDQNLKANKLVQKNNNLITIATLTSWTFRNKNVIEDIVAKGLTTTPEKFDIIIVDEAFATNGASLLDVFLYGIYTETPVLLIGDPNQLPSISNRPDKLLDQLEKMGTLYNTTTLTQVMRTNNQSIIDMAHAIMNNKLNQLAKFYTKPDINNTDPTQLMSPNDFDNNYWLKIYLASTLIKQSKSDPFNSIILVPTNALRIELNNIIQELMISQKLRDVSKSIKLPNGTLLVEGDIVMVSETQEVTDLSRSNHPKVRLRGATRIKITNINPITDNGVKYNKFKKSELRWNDRKYRIEIYSPDLDRTMIVDLFDMSSSGYNPGMHDPDVHELYHDLNIGYAATVNKVQGLSIENIQVYLDDFYPHVSRNLLYSAVTRARASVALIADPKTLSKALSKKDNQMK